MGLRKCKNWSVSVQFLSFPQHGHFRWPQPPNQYIQTMALTHGQLIFAQTLDEKLQKIEKDTNLYIHNDLNSFSNKKMTNKPQFITTVKKGVFLDPPPEVAALLGLTTVTSSIISPHSVSSASENNSIMTNSTQRATVVMYSYSSKPKILHKTYHTDCGRRLNNNSR